MLSLFDRILDHDFFKEGQKEDCFVGRPYGLSYQRANVLISDYWKHRVCGIPQGSFLLAFYDNPRQEEEVEETLLLRVLRPAALPTDNTVISSMIEYYKDNLNTSGPGSDLDDFTRFEFSFSGLECRILGSFYRQDDRVVFGADVENFYSAHNYKVYKASGPTLKLIVNQRDHDVRPGGKTEFPIGRVRYSSSRRFYDQDKGVNEVSVYMDPNDMLGKRTALFGMTRTGKSNTVKKVIEATTELSQQEAHKSEQRNAKSLDCSTGQIIFDINGEYANANLQDEGEAIFTKYRELTERYSILEKDGFRVMRVNFYRDVVTGFDYIRSSLDDDRADYVTAFKVVDLQPPTEEDDFSTRIRYNRKLAIYLCCLYRAGFRPPEHFRVRFDGQKEVNELVAQVYENISSDPTTRLTLEEATNWWKAVWEQRDSEFFTKYKRRKGKEWIDEEMMAMLTFLMKQKPTGTAVSGYVKLKRVLDLHTHTADSSFQKDIVGYLRQNKIVIIDLSQGNPEVQATLSERICREVFDNSMRNFIANKPNNYIQFYFEEAHNLFPKKDDKDLSQIYNRIAKEGAKLNLGMIYATQEVSSISANILKNTQNWFIAHLNNEDETRELRKYYDFADFTEQLVRFAARNDKGFVRMKTYSNPFVVPVQIDKFQVANGLQ